MPTQRRRIGFLPRSEVQDIIDKICNRNKLSQSKVTGILVEEALISRGVLNTSRDSASFNYSAEEYEKLLTASKTINRKIANDEDIINLDDSSINEEVQMINDFIEFKFFKNVMNNNKRNLK